jgi:hypothetical protein
VPKRVRHPVWGERIVSDKSADFHTPDLGWTLVADEPAEAVSGSAADVLDRVNGDPVAARAALAAETARENPRKSLVTELSRVAESDQEA